MKIFQFIFPILFLGCSSLEKRQLSDTEIGIVCAITATVVGSAVNSGMAKNTNDSFLVGSTTYFAGSASALYVQRKLSGKQKEYLDLSNLDKPKFKGF